ncbi:hypothetical protein [Sorangium sp. So ce1078]|uniref:hypothetical protein n=1 Tax=Sorangium sp. So ce1078 TaxID=3133329 RepID=UPI003F636923
MNTLRKIQAGVGLALVSAFAFVTASASADDVSPGSDDASRQPGIHCTMSSGFTLTGREWGYVSLTRAPGVCRRIRLGGAAPVDFPSCHQRARNELGCHTVVD